ncbi:MAG: prephenate dehydratase, partial [Anderseniella sp.]|nr:prephenate dehydratase [Anderseniella sp.]
MGLRGKRIAYQGEPGANSHIACLEAYPDMDPVACRTFEDAFAAVAEGDVALAMIPIDNTVAGRVADIHHLMPASNLFIVGEHFLRVRHQLLVLPGTTPQDLKRITSHTHALGQCRRVIAEMGLEAVVAVDTAGAAKDLARTQDKSTAVIASAKAAEIYGLEVLRPDIEDEDHNTTRFVVMSAEPDDATPDEAPVITSFIFTVRNVPAALYKAMGGFATNGVNMIKLESYVDGTFNVAQFYADIEGHPQDRPVRLALEELEFFTSSLRVLGVYRAGAYREELARKRE